MAVRIEMVEREFILGSAAETGLPARLQASGRTLSCRLMKVAKEGILLATAAGPAGFHPREKVSVFFDFRGQTVVFDSRVLKSGPSTVELDPPEAMYRSLQRRWPRVPNPRGISVDLMLPGAGLELDCPESREWVEVERPEAYPGLDTESLAKLVDSFKALASAIADEGRVVMYKGRGPADYAEEMAARLGKALFLPSLSGPLPEEDPYEPKRLVTRELAEDYEGPSASAADSLLASCLAEKAAEGQRSLLWCPVSYYRYTVGMVMLCSGSRELGYEALDLAWDFSRLLAWFLKRHRYFAAMEEARSKGASAVVDASPAGLLVRLPAEGPGAKIGTTLKLALSHGGKNLVCDARIARCYDEGHARYYGIAFRELPLEESSALAAELYGGPTGLPEEGQA
ncbi:MAG TPA: PilZ domain-containing protein [Spirochaetia bacterium]|nr:PilZ domain-containing protein [Spirochaetia bacterium]